MKRKSYSSDVTDEQWQALQENLPKARSGRTGRPRKHPLREVVNGLFYQLRTGCPWRDLPHDLPPWETVYDLFRRWRNAGTIECLRDDLREQARVASQFHCPFLYKPLQPTDPGKALHVLSFLGPWWGVGEPRFPGDFATGYTQVVNRAGGAMTWDVLVERSGHLNAAFAAPLRAIGDAISAVSL